MNRTYNFQVDNGIFVAEYYLAKEYQKITEEDLRENISLLAEKLKEYNEMSTLSFSSHLNTSLTQGRKSERKERIEKQLTLLLESIGDDKNCMICGKKRVNIEADLPYSSLLYGLASHNKFMNRGNNLRTVDVCPICLFYSLLSFLNTQKISYPFVYISDSDEFMRDITERIQEDISKNIMLDIKQEKIAQNFIPIMSEIISASSEGVYEDLTYISLIQYTNGKTNFFKDTEISKKTLDFILRVKDKGLINEFYNLGLFYNIMKGNNLLRQLAKAKKEFSVDLYNIIKEEVMSKDEIKLIEYIADTLMEQYGAEEVLKELKVIKNQQGFRQLLIKYTKDIDLEVNLTQIDIMIGRYREYGDYIRLAIQMKAHRENRNKGGNNNGK